MFHSLCLELRRKLYHGRFKLLRTRHPKALANEDTLLPTQMFPRLPARATFVADTNFVSGTQKNVSDFVQKHFVSAANVSQFAQPKKHHGQRCVRNNVSSFTNAFANQAM